MFGWLAGWLDVLLLLLLLFLLYFIINFDLFPSFRASKELERARWFTGLEEVSGVSLYLVHFTIRSATAN